MIIILCECEMVPKSAVQSILNNSDIQSESVLLHNIGARSRIGKGACQGTYCGLRITAQLYSQGTFQQDQGIADLTHFTNSRWKGQRAVLFGEQLKQAELQEAIYCGLFDLELPNPAKQEPKRQINHESTNDENRIRLISLFLSFVFS